MWRVEALEDRQYEVAAWVIYCMASMKAKEPTFEPADFHPRLLREKAKREEEVRQHAPDALASLPKEMSEEEIERQWQIVKDYLPKDDR